VVFLVRFYEEEGLFTMAEVLEGINNKMIERHPHVFKYKKKTTSKAVIDTWQKNKQKEKNRDSILDGLPASAPALIYAFLLGQRAAGCGFDWPSPTEALEKVKEEITELEKSLKLKKQNQVAEELGDVMFSLVNVCRLLNLNPEIVLHQANKKFEKRFRLLEKELTRKGQKVQPHSTAELDRLWEQVKKDSLEIGKRPVLKKKSLGEKKQKG
jgi:MazG family protein